MKKKQREKVINWPWFYFERRDILGWNTSISVKPFGCYIFSAHWTAGLMWFRVFGPGIFIKDVRVNPPLFSERSGHRKYLQIRYHRIFYLKNKEAY